MIDEFSEPLIDLYRGSLVDPVVTTGINPLELLLPMIAALVISMVVIPVMIRLAPVVGMIDKPDPRKVHAVPIPRVGGVGIVLGALLPIILLLPLDQMLLSYLFGALVLFFFGVLDDCKELGHYAKFIGQFIAVIAVVYFGDVYVTQLPFMGGESVSETIGRPFTVFAMVGMINAINHSDGLDGLAGGESLLSLAAIAWLSHLAGGMMVTLIALTTIGGLFGFMRFNTHPAKIFMGDGGSQFLGFTLGFLTVLLTQDVNPALSPALPALLLGLPIADIIAVFAQRVYHRMNWFRATKNHIHHRLLELGFRHYESVVAVYCVQAVLVFCAVMMPYASDGLILGLYLLIVASVFIFLTMAERRSWRIHKGDESALMDELIESATHSPRLIALSGGVVTACVAMFVLAGSLISTRVPPDFTIAASILGLVLFVRLVAAPKLRFIPLRLLAYVAILFVVYLSNTYQPSLFSGADPLTYVFFAVLVAAIAFYVRFSADNTFTATPMDFLVVIVILGLAVLSSQNLLNSRIMAIALKSIILFYGSEVILSRMKHHWNLFTVAILVSLLVISLRGVHENFI